MPAPQPGCCPECALFGLTAVRVQWGMCAFGHRAPGAPVAGDVPWGAAELAEHRGVRRGTIDNLRARPGSKVIPEPDGTVSGRPYWWRSKITEGPAMNERTRLANELTAAVMERLREADGAWVAYAGLRAMAPEGRVVRVPELEGEEPFGADYAHGGAYDAGPSGKPDGGMLAGCLSEIQTLLKGSPQRLDEGYPRGDGDERGQRSFRLVTSPVLHEGDVIILPQGMSYEGERAVLAEHLLDAGPDRWRAVVQMPGTPHDGEPVTIARGWAETAEVVR